MKDQDRGMNALWDALNVLTQQNNKRFDCLENKLSDLSEGLDSLRRFHITGEYKELHRTAKGRPMQWIFALPSYGQIVVLVGMLIGGSVVGIMMALQIAKTFFMR